MIDRSGETVIVISPQSRFSISQHCCATVSTHHALLQMGISPILVSVDALISEASVAQFGICRGRLSQPRLLLQVVTCAMCNSDAIRNNILTTHECTSH